jgi:hypothetical protein
LEVAVPKTLIIEKLTDIQSMLLDSTSGGTPLIDTEKAAFEILKTLNALADRIEQYID